MARCFKIGSLLLIKLILIRSLVTAQITIDASQMFTNFKFITSQGTKDNSYSNKITGSYSVGYLYSSAQGLLVRASIGMNRAGATMVYDQINYSWDLQYGNIKAGVGYIYQEKNWKPYLSISPYFSYLFAGNQSLNNQNFDIVKMKSLKRTDIGLNLTPGVQLKINTNFSLYTEFNYLMGLSNIENGGSGEKTYNRAYAFTLGTLISF